MDFARTEGRVGYIDAARCIGIFLVYHGHIVERMMYLGNAAAAHQYKFIYAFHMPLFVLMAGLFAKVRLEQKDYEALIVRVLLPLILFQAAYLAPDLRALHEDLEVPRRGPDGVWTCGAAAGRIAPGPTWHPVRTGTAAQELTLRLHAVRSEARATGGSRDAVLVVAEALGG